MGWIKVFKNIKWAKNFKITLKNMRYGISYIGYMDIPKNKMRSPEEGKGSHAPHGSYFFHLDFERRYYGITMMYEYLYTISNN